MFESARLAKTFLVYDGGPLVAGPVEYPLSCSPQAWAAGAVALFVRAMLGAEPDPHKRELFAAPVLPERIEELRLEGVPAFGGRFSLGT